MDFKDINEKIDTVEGFFQPMDQYIWDWILTLQNEENTYGHMAEVGVYKGKSLCKLAQHQKGSEHILGIDHWLTEEGYKSTVLNAIKKTSNVSLGYVNLVPNKSEFISGTSFTHDTTGITTDFRNLSRFVHIDGEHSGYCAYKDLELADKMLGPKGILAMDDWTTIFYPDIVDAFYRYIIANPNSFKILLISECKMYACRPREHSNYLWRMETKMVPFLKEHYEKPFRLFRTKSYVDTPKMVIMHQENDHSSADTRDSAIDVLV